MTSIQQLSTPVKIHRIPTRIGFMELLIDEGGARWTPALSIATLSGLGTRDLAITLEAHFWGAKHFRGQGFTGQFIPVHKLPQLLKTIRPAMVPSASFGNVEWLKRHAFDSLMEFKPTQVVIQPELFAPDATCPVLTIKTQDVLPPVDIVTMNGSEPVTTSLAIAQGTENEHASVILLARKYQSDLEEFGQVRFEIAPGYNNSQVEYAVLNEPQATLLITYMRNSEIVRKFKMKLVKAFYELVHRKQENPFLSMDQEQLLEFSLQQVKEKKALACTVHEQQSVIEGMKPSVEALATLTDCSGSFTITMAAKQLQMKPRALTKWLMENKWIYQRVIEPQRPEWEEQEVWIAFQRKIDSGYMKESTIAIHHRGGMQTLPQARVTSKGLTKLAKLFGQVAA